MFCIKNDFFKVAFLHAYTLFLENEAMYRRYSENGDVSSSSLDDKKIEINAAYYSIHERSKDIETTIENGNIEEFRKYRNMVAHGNPEGFIESINWDVILYRFLEFVRKWTGEEYGESYWFLS